MQNKTGKIYIAIYNNNNKIQNLYVVPKKSHCVLNFSPKTNKHDFAIIFIIQYTWV